MPSQNQGNRAAIDLSPSPPPLTAAEIANFLSITVTIARRLMREQRIRSFKVGGQWRAYPSDVAEFISAELEKGGRAGK